MFESVGDHNRQKWKLRLIAAAAIAAVAWGFVGLWRMTQMPLRSYRGALPVLTPEQAKISSHLSRDVGRMASSIGERNIGRPDSLHASIDFLRDELRQRGYAVNEQTYPADNHLVANVAAELRGTDTNAGIIVVGSHYDSVAGTIGANDNASGVAATLEVARLLKDSKLRRTIRFVFFANEEPPYFQTELMGSLVYARQLRRDKIPVAAMISIETIGCYSDGPGSQRYPPLLSWFYPDRGNFIGFVANPDSRDLLRRAIRRFRESTQFPSEGIAAPGTWPGIGWSDHWSFWQEGYPAIMVTDTAPFRYAYYHTPYDTPDKLDFDKMARVVEGLKKVVTALANE